MKKLVILLMTVVMILSLCACGSKSDTYTVGICQLGQHPALDAATEGFKEALIEEFGENKIKFDEKNAQGDSNTCGTIINGFVSSDDDLIMANGTAALQAAAAGTDTIPILGTSVTEYGAALEISGFDGTVGGNVSGTSDLVPLYEQAVMLNELFPDAKEVGLLYCLAEANSQYQIDKIKAELETMGYNCTLYSFADSNDLAAVTTSAVRSCDVIYVPTDNTIAYNVEIINNICLPARVPIIAGEEGICGGCGAATLSVNYHDLGYSTGRMAVKVLKGESKIEEMPVEYASKFIRKYNKAVCDELGIKIPDGYEEIAAE